MTVDEMLKKYQDWTFKKSAYSMALSIVNFDKLTIAPAGGNEYRDERTAFLSGELFSISTDPEMIEILGKLKDEDIDPDLKRSIQIEYKDVIESARIPKNFIIEYQKLVSTSHNYWLKAKQEDDYSIFEPYLKQVIEKTKQMYQYMDPECDPYDKMLDNYEQGMTKVEYDKFFNLLKERVPKLIHEVTERGSADDSFLYVDYDIEGQKQFMEHLLKYLHFDPEWSYQGETEHPFTDWVCENDCRTTTKYLPNNAISAILSTVHECGHAWYAHNVDDKYDGTTLLSNISFGMHESQSRLCENYLARTKSFWKANYEKLQSIFPEQLGEVSLDEFVAAINVSRPSLVRTEADELTYPMHILIRYELEKGLFEGTISTEGLNETWNAMYEKYLGIKVTSDRDGILQDDHWADGAIGYFPTYALGTAFAAQFMHQMRKELDVDMLLENDRYDEIMSWLRENVHRYGCRYTAQEVLEKCTGEKFNPEYYIDYLEEKFGE